MTQVAEPEPGPRPFFGADPDQLGCAGVYAFAYPEDHAKIEVTKLGDGHCYPTIQFHTPADPDKCTEVHYHYSFFSIHGVERKDSAPCGAVKQSDIIKAGTIYVPSSVAKDWNTKYENYRQGPKE